MDIKLRYLLFHFALAPLGHATKNGRLTKSIKIRIKKAPLRSFSVSGKTIFDPYSNQDSGTALAVNSPRARKITRQRQKLTGLECRLQLTAQATFILVFFHIKGGRWA